MTVGLSSCFLAALRIKDTAPSAKMISLGDL